MRRRRSGKARASTGGGRLRLTTSYDTQGRPRRGLRTQSADRRRKRSSTLALRRSPQRAGCGSSMIHRQTERPRGTRPVHPLLRLQQSVGNRAVACLLQAKRQNDLIQRQPKPDGPSMRDVPILLEKLELDVGNNLFDYGHHLYRAATLHPDNPEVLKEALGRYALGANVLKDTYQFLGFKPDTAGKLAVSTGILTKGVTLLSTGELTQDFQFDVGRGVKLETNLSLGVNPKDLTDVRKAEVNVGLVRHF